MSSVGLASPLRRRSAYASPVHSRVPLLLVKPASRGFSSSRLIPTKKGRPKATSFFGELGGIGFAAASSLGLCLTGTLPCTSPPCQTRFSRVLLLTAHTNKKRPRKTAFLFLVSSVGFEPATL